MSFWSCQVVQLAGDTLKSKNKAQKGSSQQWIILPTRGKRTPTEAIHHISSWLEWSLPALWQRLGQGSQQQIRDKGWQCITVRTDTGNRNSLCHQMANPSSFCHTQISQPLEWLKWGSSPPGYLASQLSSSSWSACMSESYYWWIIKCIPSLQRPVSLCCGELRGPPLLQ